jgi:hypothetical protein
VKDGITGKKRPVNLACDSRLPRKSRGSLTCRKTATWDRRLYFPSEGTHAVDFFARKIRQLQPGSTLSILDTRGAVGIVFLLYVMWIKLDFAAIP